MKVIAFIFYFALTVAFMAFLTTGESMPYQRCKTVEWTQGNPEVEVQRQVTSPCVVSDFG